MFPHNKLLLALVLDKCIPQLLSTEVSTEHDCMASPDHCTPDGIWWECKGVVESKCHVDSQDKPGLRPQIIKQDSM